MKDKQNERSLIVTSGHKVSKSGYYVYDGHVGESCNSFVAQKAKTGLYLAEDSIAPDLGSCNHWIRWKLVTNEQPLVKSVK